MTLTSWGNSEGIQGRCDARCHNAQWAKCTCCGGDAGELSAEGAHYLCEALHRLGLPTPNLGKRCPECSGEGCRPISAPGPMLYFDAWVSLCTHCHGSGMLHAPSIKEVRS